MAVAEFLASRRDRGCEESSIEAYEDRLSLLFAGIGSRPVRHVMGRGAELYEATQVGRRADTHRNALVIGRMWGAFCVRRKWLRANPFADVDPIGKRVSGRDKIRLTIDESRVLEAWCLDHADDAAAVLTLGYLYLGSRASELVRRDARDLDDDGRLLWIGRTKTAAGQRRLAVPPELAGPLRALVAGRQPGAPIFALDTGERWSRHVARLRVRAVCALAGVPVLSPQALRRTHATLATEAGESALAVARHLGHASDAAPAVTGRSYVGQEAAAGARGERTLRVLRGGRT